MSLTEKLNEIKTETDSLITYANGITGANDTRLGDAVKSLADGFGSGGGNALTLPNSYTRLDYIENTGKGYIDTGIIPNINTEVVISWVKKFPQPEAYTTPFGVSATNSQFFGFQTAATAINTLDMRGYFSFGNMVDKKGWQPLFDTSIPLRYRFNKNGCSWISDKGDLIAAGDSFGVTSFNVTDLSIYVFARNTSGNVAGRFCKCAIYDLEINDISTKACLWHGVPAKRNIDGHIGMYDIVNNVFHENLGTTPFITI